jgi:hypothetical protein
MTTFFVAHAGLIELTLVEGIVLAFAAYELWSVRRSLRATRDARAGRAHSPADGDGDDDDASARLVSPVFPAEIGTSGRN